MNKLKQEVLDGIRLCAVPPELMDNTGRRKVYLVWFITIVVGISLAEGLYYLADKIIGVNI